MKRKLSAIVFTDIVGYTALSAQDEKKAVELIDTQRTILKPIVSKHGGEWIKEIGDGLLLTFDTITSAIDCAINIQNETKTIADLNLKIAVHVGEIIEREGDVFGDDVNITSRMESHSPVGGVVISGKVFDHIIKYPEYEAHKIGTHQLKGVRQEVSLYIITSHDLFNPGATESEVEKPPTSSIAVLPFADLSPGKDKDYFCEGVSEELINQLSQVKGLQLVSRTSSFKFKNGNVDIMEIGRLLHVKLVVEGSIQFANDDIRISARLTSVETGYQLWTKRYDRKLDNIFTVQDEIAKSIALTLKLEILGDQETSANRHSTNLDAFQEYLKGRYFWNQRNKGLLQEGIVHFENAISEDDKYSLAYSGLADSYSVQGWYNYIEPRLAYEQAKTYALKSIENGPTIAEGYVSLAYINHHYDWNWDLADKNFNEAIHLNPGYSVGHHWYAIFLASRSDFGKAVRCISTAKQLDPLSMVIKTAEGWINHMNADNTQAVLNLEKAIEDDPGFPWSYYVLAQAYEEMGMNIEALKNYKHACKLSKRAPFYLAGLGHIYGLTDDVDNASKILTEMKALKKKTFISSIDMALAGMGINPKNETLDLIVDGIEERVSSLPYISVDPRFANYIKDEILNNIETGKS